jgi:hypothetical protein
MKDYITALKELHDYTANKIMQIQEDKIFTTGDNRMYLEGKEIALEQVKMHISQLLEDYINERLI